ncbi:hypothetical protein PLESTB_001031400 [Pleodorina starrii]|uniref:Uncharacterized protein n=1 Tax=Pleodorina starrii TaxID=330485 RepID=A0A9W6BP16_9CHLO|nr:hypothetical protein PLESTB_001031400 [Pleodorina starrii]GLC63799.1 hypothetical protein PLESTF_000084100 [Pleodorina starrii]
MLAAGATPLQRALALSVIVGIGSLLLQLVLRLWRFPGSSLKSTKVKDDETQPDREVQDKGPHDAAEVPCSAKFSRGLRAKAPSWAPETFFSSQSMRAAPLHIHQHYLQVRSLALQALWPCRAISAPPATEQRVLAPILLHPPDAADPPSSSAPPATRDNPSGDDSSEPLTAIAAPSALSSTAALSPKHIAVAAAAAAGATDIANGHPSVCNVVGGDALPPDTDCRPDNISSPYDTARLLINQAFAQPYTPLFTLGRVALKIPDRDPGDLPPPDVWTRPYCDALEGEGIALVGAYVRHGCIHIVLDFLDLAMGPAGGGGAGGSGTAHNYHTLRHGRHLLRSERGEGIHSSSGGSSSSSSRRRSGRVAAAAEHEGAAGAGLLNQFGGRASAPGDLLPRAAPGRESQAQQQQQQQSRQRQLQLGRRNAPARVFSATAVAVAGSAARTTVLARNAAAAGGLGRDEDGDDDDDDGNAGAAARGPLHPLSARRLRQLRRASVSSLLSGAPAAQGLPGVAAAAVAAPSPSPRDGAASGAALASASVPSSMPSAAAASRLLESLSPAMLVELLGPGVGVGGQTVTVQLPLGGGAWSVQTLAAGAAAAPAAAALPSPPPVPPPDLTCISPPCILAGAPVPVVLYAAGTGMQGVAAGHGAGGDGGGEGGGGGAPLTVHVRFRGAYQPCRASLLGDQMPVEALSQVLPLDALRRAEVLCLQLPAPPPQPGLMWVECQRGGLLGAALPVLVAPNAGVWREVAALQEDAVQEGGGRMASAQRLVMDLGLWLDYLYSAPPPPQEATARQRPEAIDAGDGGGAIAVGAAEEQHPAASGTGSAGGVGGGGRGLGRLFGRSLLRLLSDAELAEAAVQEHLPPAAPLPPSPSRQCQGGLRLLEEMLTLAEEQQQQQQDRELQAGQQWGGRLESGGAAAADPAAADLAGAEEGEEMAARLHLLAPHVGVAYGSSPGPNTDGAGAAEVGLSEYFRAISDPVSHRVDTAAPAATATEEEEAAASTVCAGPQWREPAAAATAPSVPSRLDGGSGMPGGAAGGSGGGSVTAVAVPPPPPPLRLLDEGSSRELGSSAALELLCLGADPTDGAGPSFSSGYGAGPGASVDALGPGGAAAAAAAVAGGGCSRVSSGGLTLAAAAPPPPHAQSLYNGRWQLPPPLPSPPGEEKDGLAAQQEPVSASAGDGRTPPPPQQPQQLTTTQTPLAQPGGSSGVGVSVGMQPVEVCGSSPVVSSELLALGPTDAATLSQALMSFAPPTRGSGSLNLPPVRTDSSRTELRSWDSLTEVALAVSGPLSATPLSSSTTAASPSPSPGLSLQLCAGGEGPRVRALGQAAATSAVAGAAGPLPGVAAPPLPPSPQGGEAPAAAGSTPGGPVAEAHGFAGFTLAPEAGPAAEGFAGAGPAAISSGFAPDAAGATDRQTAAPPAAASPEPAAAAAGGGPGTGSSSAAPLPPQGACWPAAAAEASARLRARMRHLGLGLLAFSVRRGWVATTAELLSGLARLGVSLAEADAGVAAREGGMGLLHLAVTARRPELLRALPAAAAAAAAGAAAGGESASPSTSPRFSWDVGARGPMGLTPLHLATALDDGGEVAALLLASFPGAPAAWFTAADDGGCTPAEMAAQARLEGLSELARVAEGAGWQRQLAQSRPQQLEGLQVLQRLGQLQCDPQEQIGLRVQQGPQQGPQQGAQLQQGQPQPASTCSDADAASVEAAAAAVVLVRHAAVAAGGGVERGCKGSPEGSAAAASTTVARLNRWWLAPVPLVPSQRRRPQWDASWLRTSLTGFTDPRVEAQYRMHRAASLGVVDRTCGLLFLLLFLLPALNLARQQRARELASHCLFNAGLLGPYLLAAAAPATFRAHRDAALMATDVVKAALVLLALLHALPLPRVWADFARGHKDVLMLVVMKPLAEQISVRAALLQRAAAVVSDAHIYARVLYGGAVVPALARAVLQNAAALLLLLVLDVRARRRFQEAAAAAASSCRCGGAAVATAASEETAAVVDSGGVDVHGRPTEGHLKAD